MLLVLFTIKVVTSTPLKRTSVLARLKLVPLILTTSPTEPEAGVKLVMVGVKPPVTVKLLVLKALPLAFDTIIRPEVAPVGITNVSWLCVNIVVATGLPP